MTSSPYDPYELGYTRITMIVTKESNSASWSKIHKSSLSTDYSLKVENMKEESLVIANQHVAVNMSPVSRHTARHAMGIGFM